MIWVKKGLVFEPPTHLSWLESHAAVPFAMHLQESRYRVYFSGRDASNRSHIGYFEIDLERPDQILQLSERPVLSPGPLGSFDEHGAMVSWIVSRKGKHFLFYTGWSRGLSVPFVNSIGLAISDDGGKTFSKFSDGPLMARNAVDPYWVSNPCVLVEEKMWRMWYLSGTRWETAEEGAKPHYHIRYATSRDGIHWKRDGKVCIDFQSSGEHAISRPCVLKEENVYQMWYSFRGDRYRIGYAESLDGLQWIRRDAETGIDVSGSGWDSEMIEYGFVFFHGDRYYMLYNGNGYGKTGIGLAVSTRTVRSSGNRRVTA